MKLTDILTVGRAVSLSLLAVALVAGTADAADEGETPQYSLDAATGIVINPRVVPQRTVPVTAQATEAPADESAGEDLPVITPSPVGSPEYRAIFNSIPFSRAEFDANPSYRHDATMELLTGNPRPQKIVTPPPAPPAPPADYYLPNLPVMRHYFDMTRGPYSRYQNLFGYSGGYRPMFYNY